MNQDKWNRIRERLELVLEAVAEQLLEHTGADGFEINVEKRGKLIFTSVNTESSADVDIYYQVEGELSKWIHNKDDKNSFYGADELELAKQAAHEINTNPERIKNKDEKVIVTKNTIISLDEKVY